MQYKKFLFILLILTSCYDGYKPVSYQQTEEFVDYANSGNSVYFKFGSAKIENEGVKRVNELIYRLSIVRDVDVLLYGYDDKAGEGSHNKKLAEQRVHAIKKALEDSGVLKEGNIRIKAVSYGEHDPLVSFGTVDNNPKSRRVDVFIVNRKR